MHGAFFIYSEPTAHGVFHQILLGVYMLYFYSVVDYSLANLFFILRSVVTKFFYFLFYHIFTLSVKGGYGTQVTTVVGLQSTYGKVNYTLETVKNI